MPRNQRDPARAIPACEAALRVEPSNPRIAFQLGLAHDAARDHSRSVEFYRQAAQAGYAAALFAVGWAHANGKGVECNDALASQFYERAAAAGHAGAQNTLGFMYENGRGVARDHALAARWYGRAAAAGRSISQFNLGRLMSAGRGVPQDVDGAVRLYRATVQAGRSDAALHLAIVAEQGRAPQVGRAEMLFAFALAEHGADQGDRARRSLDAAAAAGSADEVRAARAQAAEVAARLERTLEQETAQREAALARLRPEPSQSAGATAAAAERRAAEEARQRAEADAAAARLARVELETELERLRQARLAARDGAAAVPVAAVTPAPAKAPEQQRTPTLADLRAAPIPFSAEYATVAGEVGCRSTEPQSARVARFREQYENRDVVWQGKVRSISPVSVALDMGEQRDEVIAAMVAGHDTANVADGSTVMVRLRLTAPGSCNQAFRGTEGVLLRIDGKIIP